MDWISTRTADTSVCNVAAASFYAISNITNKSSTATHFARCRDLTCQDKECVIQQPRVVRLNVTDAASGEVVPTFYEFIRQPCVELMFYNNATLVTNSRGPYRGKSNSGKEALCANPEVPVATATCCTSSTRAWWAGGGGANTVFTGERVSHELAKERCAPIWDVTKTD